MVVSRTRPKRTFICLENVVKPVVSVPWDAFVVGGEAVPFRHTIVLKRAQRLTVFYTNKQGALSLQYCRVYGGCIGWHRFNDVATLLYIQ